MKLLSNLSNASITNLAILLNGYKSEPYRRLALIFPIIKEEESMILIKLNNDDFN